MKSYPLRRSLVQLIACVLLAHCANPGRESKPAAQPPVEEERPLAADATAFSSRIVLKFRSEDRLRQIKATVIGVESSPSLMPLAEQPGRYMLGPLKPGAYNVLLEAMKLPDDPSQKAYGVALLVSGIDVAENQDSFINDANLTPYLTVKGSIHLSSIGAPTQPGIEVAIPQTSLKTLTDVDGNFTFDKVPEGHHALEVRFAGYRTGIFEMRAYKSSMTLPSLTLLAEDQSFPVGIHYLGEGLSNSDAAKVTVFLQRPEGLTQFRWGFTPDLSGAAWQTYQSSFDIDVSPAQRLIYVQFARDGRQLSSVYILSLPSL